MTCSCATEGTWCLSRESWFCLELLQVYQFSDAVTAVGTGLQFTNLDRFLFHDMNFTMMELILDLRALGTNRLDFHLIPCTQNIMDALKTVSADRTSIFIAHRLTTIADADEIFVLDKGRVAEQGTHSQLLSRPSSLYSELWHSQHASVKLN